MKRTTGIQNESKTLLNQFPFSGCTSTADHILHLKETSLERKVHNIKGTKLLGVSDCRVLGWNVGQLTGLGDPVKEMGS